jgi:sucrose-6-phosphate hydrolase SacC (GH32 family)
VCSRGGSRRGSGHLVAANGGGALRPTPDWRPRAHFTAADSWLNDPNGLVFHDGTYHLYFQNNPTGAQWGDIAWGHATSPDLVTWTEQPVAIPATADEMVFSGSAVVDTRDTAGFGPGAIVAIYTSHYRPGSSREGRQAQSLAVSLDGGYTFERYGHNPVLDEQLADFRDPKVFWFGDDGGHWVMAVAEPHDLRVGIYTSPDLRTWTRASTFGPAGNVGGIWECPDVVRIPVRGEHAPAWALVVSLSPGGPTGGSGTQFFVGDFDGCRFTPTQPDPEWLDHGHDYYAAVSFNDVPGGAAVTIAWASSWAYAERVPTHPWRSAMSLARTLEFVRGDDGRLVLHQVPVLPARSGLVVEHVLSLSTSGTVRLHGAAGAGTSEVDIRVDRESGTVTVDRSRCGGDALGGHFASPAVAPLCPRDETRLRIVVDASILEVYVDGVTTLTEQVFPDAPLTELTVEGTPRR